MRYAEMVTSPTEIPPVPGLPGAAGQSMMSLGMTVSLLGDEDLMDRTAAKDDKKLLEDENFEPETFLKLKLANSTEAELKSLQSSLQGAKNDVNSELQHNVFKNYAEFVLISKEITSLESEMLELKDLLSEYKSMPSVLHIPDPTALASSSNYVYKRSSVTDLRIMYLNQMQELHAHIEGAAKFAPVTPGRHVVAEFESVLSLNAATYKVVGRVRFVLLDDLVLVARRRRRNVGATNVGADGGGGTVNEGKLVAERCWPLSEMLVLDTKDSARMTNVFKIRHGKETHVYRTENPADKKSLLSQFRHVAEELAAKKRKEREGEHERRKTILQVGGGGGDRNSIPPMPDWMTELAKRGGEIPGTESGAKEKAERDALWVGEWADDLTVAIALREWEKAVTLVEQGKAKLAITPLLGNKLPTLTSLLTNSLLSSLSLPTVRKSSVVFLISLLLRLKAGPAARSTFLDMRTKVLKAHVRKIRFEGHVGAYVGDLAVVYFTGIKHTADWFLASFKENEVSSTFVDWAKKQLEDFAEIFRKQVYTSDVDSTVMEDAMKITFTQSKKLLQEFGLDFRFLLDSLLVAKPKETIKPTPHFTFEDHAMPKIEPVPASRRRGVPPQPTIQTEPDHEPPPPQMDTLAPPPSAFSMRSNPLSPSLLTAPLSNASGASGYSSMSNYSSISAAVGTPSAPFVSFNLPPRENNHSPVPGSPLPTPHSAALPSRSRTPVSGAPPRARTPFSAAPPREGARTPISARPHTPVSAVPGLGPGTRTPVSGIRPVTPLSAPGPLSERRPRTPPVRREPERDREGEQEREKVGETGEGWLLERQKSLRMMRSGPSPAPPPRSTNRPGSSAGPRPPPVAIPPREGMI